MKKALILSVMAIGVAFAMKPENKPDVRVYDYANIVDPSNDFHEDYDSTFVDGTTDCLHFTFKNGHQCDFTANNPAFK